MPACYVSGQASDETPRVRTVISSVFIPFRSSFFWDTSALSAFPGACCSRAHFLIQSAHQLCSKMAPAHIQATVRVGFSVSAWIMSRCGLAPELEMFHCAKIFKDGDDAGRMSVLNARRDVCTPTMDVYRAKGNDPADSVVGSAACARTLSARLPLRVGIVTWGANDRDVLVAERGEDARAVARDAADAYIGSSTSASYHHALSIAISQSVVLECDHGSSYKQEHGRTTPRQYFRARWVSLRRCALHQVQLL